METQSPVVTPAADTDPDSPCPSPYFTAPSSPKHTRQSSNVAGDKSDSVSDPEDSHSDVTVGGDDFAFELSGDLDSALLSADELFDSGVIRALKPPAPGLSQQHDSTARGSVSTVDQPFPRRRLEAAAAETGRRDTGLAGSGRDRDRDLKSSWWFGTSSCSSCSFRPRSCWKWRVKDLVSLRSSVAGEAKRGDSRFRSASGNGESVVDERRLEKAEVLNRKVETAPCRVGLWGCMRFNHCAAHGLCKGLGNGLEWMTTDR